jgi:hypothetical protein
MLVQVKRFLLTLHYTPYFSERYFVRVFIILEDNYKFFVMDENETNALLFK